MAVEDKFIETNRAAGLKTDPVESGARSIQINRTFEVAAADDDGSVYRLFSIPSNAIPKSNGFLRHDNITGGTDYDAGLYETGVGGAEKDKDLFLDGADLANTTDLDPFSLANTVDNSGKALWELLGESSDPGVMYDYAITGNTVGTAAGTINVELEFKVQG